MVRYSKVQKHVLQLYRQFLKAVQDRPGVKDHVRNEFKKNSTLPRTDIMHIEYLIRRGERQLNQLKTSEVKGIGVFQKGHQD